MTEFLLAGGDVIPLAVLAVLAYLGRRWRWARYLALAWLALVLLAAAGYLLVLGMPATPDPGGTYGIGPDAAARRIALGLSVAMAVGAAAGTAPVRRRLSRYIPLDPHCFVHAVALVGVTALTLMVLVPLLVLGQPPLLARPAGGGETFSASVALQNGYWLIWMLLLTPFATGLGIERDPKGVMMRLGLRRPTLRQLFRAVAGAVGLAVLAQGGIDWVFQRLHWPATDRGALQALWASSLTPFGIVLVALSAGVGEELVYRGLLQPRLGVVLSSSFFAASHALQYSWDYLLPVLALGFTFAWVRRSTSTTVSAILHGTYNLAILSLLALWR